MDNIWFASALWIGLALAAAVLQNWVAVSIALLEIIVGAVAGNIVDLTLTPWVNYLAGFGAILLTFLAGAEIDVNVIRRNFGATMSIGLVGFFAPYLGVLAFAHFVSGWPWPQAQIAGIALSTTSVAVVYAVMIETGFNQTELGKIILAACFVNDLGTVLALGIVFANYNIWMISFAVATLAILAALPRFTPWFFKWVGNRVSEPQIKFVLLLLFVLGGLANTAKSEAVLPAYLIGIVLAPVFLKDRELMHRVRVIAFTILTPFYFLKAGSLVRADVILTSFGLILVYLAVKMVTKFVGILPLTRFFRFEPREGMYTTLLMSTGLTFGSISALFGLTNHIIDEGQYTILLTAVIGSAVVPTLIAERWFQPVFKPLVAAAPAIAEGDSEMFAKILVANDGSPGALKAFAAAVTLAKNHGAALDMVTVEELPRFPASIDEVDEVKAEEDHRLRPVLEAARIEALAAGLPLATHIIAGHPVEAIVTLIGEQQFDLLVVGFMGHSALYQRIIGGTTDRLVDLAPCAVLVVK